MVSDDVIFVIWTTQHLGISATNIGIIYSINAMIALLMQPIFGYISDKLGLKKRLVWFLILLLLPVGPFLSMSMHHYWSMPLGRGGAWRCVSGHYI